MLKFQTICTPGASDASLVLLHWVQQKIPNCNVKDFRSSWSDGLALCHLCAALKPETFSADELAKLSSSNALRNVKNAFAIASRHFDIPTFIEPADLVENPDEVSILVYLSYFRNYEEHHTDK